MRYLIDTDWVIHYLRGVGRVVERVLTLAPEGVGISIVSLAELQEGIARSATPEVDAAILRGFLTTVTVVDLDEDTCRIFGRERARLRAEGNLIGDLDLLIGATAVRHGLTLLTNNRRHFERLADLAIESV